MPRLELAAGVLSVKVAGMVMKELATEDVSEYFWTERQVVLGNIRNTQRRFKIFKAIRSENTQTLHNGTICHQR